MVQRFMVQRFMVQRLWRTTVKWIKYSVFCWLCFMATISTSTALAKVIDDPESYAYQVKVVMKSGAGFDAVIKDKEIIKLLQENRSLDLDELDKARMITLFYMNGLNGSMGLKIKNMASFTGLLPLSEKQFEDAKAVIERRVDGVRDKEKVRLEKLKEKRARESEKKAAEAAKKKEELAEEARKKAEAKEIEWVLRFPPDDGWGPEKKEELYRRGIVIDVYPNEEEQTFLDHYTEWLAQYEIWKARLEKKAGKDEEKEKTRGKAGKTVEKKKEENKKSEQTEEEKDGS